MGSDSGDGVSDSGSCAAGEASPLRGRGWRRIAGDASPRSSSLPRRAHPPRSSRRCLSSPAVIIKHRYTNSGTNSESCGSSVFSVSRSMDLERRILLYLFNIKFRSISNEWRASDDWVLNIVHKWCESSGFNMNMDQIKQQVNEFEERVKSHKEQTAEIVQDTNMMLELFDYITPDIVKETPPENLGTPTQIYHTPNIKRFSPENAGTRTEIYPTPNIKRVKMTSYPASTSHSNDSIGQQFSRLLEEREVLQDILTGPLSMDCCIDKLEKLGFNGSEFFVAIDMLKADMEVRQIFIKLGDSKAKNYVLHLLKKQIS